MRPAHAHPRMGAGGHGCLSPGATIPIVILMADYVTVMLNGERRDFAGPLNVTALLAAIGLEARKVAVERNEEIVPRSVYADTMLLSGDQLEIVHFIGGG